MTQAPSGDSVPVFDPRGEVTVAPQAPAPRLAELAGLRLAVLDNSKWNAGNLLRRIVDQLEPLAGLAEVRFYTKETFSRAASPELIERIAGESDLALTAIGD